jgi:hypothetical protein
VGRNAKRCFQGVLHWLTVFLLQRPQNDRAGVLPGAGVRYIENIAEPRAVAVGIQQGDALCAAFDIATHSLVPEVILCAGGGIRSLGMDHQLLMVGILVKPAGGSQK